MLTNITRTLAHNFLNDCTVFLPCVANIKVSVFSKYKPFRKPNN